MFSVLILLILIEMVTQLTTSQTSLPLFSPSTSQDEQAIFGDDILLHCQVEHLDHHTVSWIRQRDLQILTVGGHTFTTDNRIAVKHSPRNEDFMLVIRQVSEDDLGLYECQINTSPVKIRVVAIHRKEIFPALQTFNQKANLMDTISQTPKPRLKLFDLPENSGSSTSIIGSPNIYFQPGSLVNISCLVHSLKQPEHIFWYHNGEVISYYSSRGGISVIRKRGEEDTITMSSLIIREAREEDQGTYLCRPLTGDFKSARTRLFIGQGAVLGARISKAEKLGVGKRCFCLVVFSIVMKYT
jgi:hypothetical protein